MFLAKIRRLLPHRKLLPKHRLVLTASMKYVGAAVPDLRAKIVEGVAVVVETEATGEEKADTVAVVDIEVTAAEEKEGTAVEAEVGEEGTMAAVTLLRSELSHAYYTSHLACRCHGTHSACW